MSLQFLRNALRTLLVAAIFILALQSAYAVDTNGRIIGKVTDPTGALVPGAQITATNLLTGVKYTTVSQKDGGYFFAQLPIGTYSITAAATGFKTFQASGIVIRIDQEYNEPVQFTSGSENETVSVNADSIQVNTTDMQLNNVVEASQMVELPNIARSFTLYETIEPGVQASSDRFGGYSADGAQTQQSNFLVNGADVNDLPLNTVGINPNLDAIAQFNLVTGPLNAEYDRNSGGIVSATLSQGTNQYHGDLFEFYRDTFLNTGNYFQNVAATPTVPQHKDVTPYHQNIFGATIGGRIIKDKLFFFGAYQGTRQSAPNNNGGPSTTVFSQAQRTGDFSTDLSAGGSVQGYTFSAVPIPGTLNIPNCPAGTTWAACAATNGGVFPTSAFNPIAASLLQKYVPQANQGLYGYTFNNFTALSDNQYIVRMDFDPNPKNQFYAIWINDKSTSNSTTSFYGGSLPGFGEVDGHTDNQLTADYVRQLSPTAVNDFAVHYTRFNDILVNPQTILDPATLGFAIHPQNVAAESLPLMTVGSAYFTLGFSGNGPQPRIDQTYQVDDSLSKTFGNHSVKFGYDGQKFLVSNPFSANNNGSYGFHAGTTYGSGDPGLDFLLGNPSSYAQGTGATIQAFAFLNYFYAQDAWKATNTLTINYGMGYQIDTPLHNQQYGGEAIACFIPGQQSVIFPTAPVGLNYAGDPGCTNSAQAYTRYNEFGPRIGFAWAPNLGKLSGGASGKLSIRGGYGIYYNRTEEETSLNNLDTPPFGVTSQGANDYGASAPGFANPYQDINTGTVYPNKFPFTFPTKGQKVNYGIFEPMFLNTYDKGFRSPYSNNFQLSIEREMPSHIIARLSYVGALGRHNQIVYEANPITAAGHAACLADTVQCANPASPGYRNGQNYYFPNHTKYGTTDPTTGIPYFASIGVVTSEGSSSYNSFQASVEKGMSHGLQFQLSYTLSHSLDDASSYENAGYGGSNGRGYNQFVKALNYGNSAFDARHRIVFAPIYTVPSISGHAAYSPINLALSGWQISGISSAATGFPFDISYGGGSSNSLWCSPYYAFYACPDEPNQTGSLVRANPRTFIPGTNTTQWFVAKSSGLSQAPLGRFGDISRNKYHGPGVVNTNLIIAKNFNLRADGVMRLQIRMESDNVFNHTNFNNPDGTVTSTTNGETLSTPGSLSYGGAGQISSAGFARQTQLAAKFYF